MIPTDNHSELVLEEHLFSRVCSIVKGWELGYAEVGLICQTVKAKLLWKYRVDPSTNEPCVSFNRWMQLAAPRSFATSHAALRDVHNLHDIPEADLIKIPATNFPIMLQLSTGVRADPVVLEAAKTKPTEAFVEHIREHYPEQHLERKVLMRFRPEESAARKIEEALRMAQLHGANNRNEALELIAEEAVRQWEMEDEIREAVARMEHEPHP